MHETSLARLILAAASLLFALSGQASGTDEAASRRAKVLSEEARKQYALGDYQQALEDYKAAFLAKPDPSSSSISGSATASAAILRRR
jgi:hypothetical protein